MEKENKKKIKCLDCNGTGIYTGPASDGCPNDGKDACGTCDATGFLK